MQTDNSILFVSAVLLSALYIYFYFKPLKLTELTGKTYAAFLGATIALLVLILDGIYIVVALGMLVMIAVITLERVPVVRIIEAHTGNGTVMINRIINRYYWPTCDIVSNTFRSGKFLGFLPWVEGYEGFQYIYRGKTFNSLREFHSEHPLMKGVAEDALNKSLGALQ